MRAFIAIETPKPEAPGYAFDRAEDHVTFHFFPELPATELARCVEAMHEVVRPLPAFPFELEGVGAFPTRDRPRVIWAGVGRGHDRMQALASRLREILGHRGYPAEDRPFVPHVTLFRVRSGSDRERARSLLADPQLAALRLGEGVARELVLVESQLSPEGARHTVRARAKLAGDG
jgi:2'-5' RNA ligase